MINIQRLCMLNHIIYSRYVHKPSVQLCLIVWCGHPSPQPWLQSEENICREEHGLHATRVTWHAVNSDMHILLTGQYWYFKVSCGYIRISTHKNIMEWSGGWWWQSMMQHPVILKLETNLRKVWSSTFSWSKAPTSTFTFKNLLRHYAEQVLTHCIWM